MISSRLKTLTPLALALMVLAGCASKPVAEEVQVPSAEVYAKSLADADALSAAGNQEAAVSAYRKIAIDNPTKPDPWVKVAQIDFAQGHYSQAIVSAEETLKRDPSNRQAKSITAVGGLRLAVRSLEELRVDSALAGDARSDAYKLAAMLRETLGEPVLEPAPKPEPAPRRPAVRRPAAAPKPAAEVAPAARPAATGGGANPFGALK